ncbi:MAG: hypothetical protein ACRDFT_07560 [bacterium]
MFEKTCPRCGQSSYSAAANRHWICPTCGFDLTAAGSRSVVLPPGALSTAAPPPAPPAHPAPTGRRRRLRLVDVVWRPAGEGEPQVAVLLRNGGGAEHRGVAEASTAQEPAERLVAEATLRAIQDYLSGLGIELNLAVKVVQITDHPAGPLVTVAVGLAGQPAELEFAGAALAGDPRQSAAAKAVLHSLNRYLERFLRWPRDARTAPA